MIRTPTPPSFKDCLLQKYLNPFRISDEDRVELKKQFPDSPVDLFADMLMEKDFISNEDEEKLKECGVYFLHGKARKWQQLWVQWAATCMNSTWFLQLHDKTQETFFATLGELDEMGLSTKELIRFVHLQQEQPHLAAKALFALGKIGSKASESVNFLAHILKTSYSPELLFNALWALGQMGSEAVLAKDALFSRLAPSNASLEFRNRQLRQEAIRVIANLAPLLVKDLVRLYQENDYQDAVLEILRRNSNAAFIELLLLLCQSEGEQSDLIKEITILSSSENLWNRCYQILTQADNALSARLTVIKAMTRLQEYTFPVLRMLGGLVVNSQESLEIREASAEALTHFGSKGQVILSKILQKLSHPTMKNIVSELLAKTPAEKDSDLSGLFRLPFLADLQTA